MGTCVNHRIDFLVTKIPKSESGRAITTYEVLRESKRLPICCSIIFSGYCLHLDG